MMTIRRRLYDRSKSAPLSVRIARYLREGQIAEIALTNFRHVRVSPRRVVLRAESSRGPLAIKFLDRHHARRAISSSRVLRHLPPGLGPDCLYADVDPKTLRGYGLSCLAWRWIEGRHLDLANQLDTSSMMKLLAGLNGARCLATDSSQAERDRSAAGIILADRHVLARSTHAFFDRIARAAGWGDHPELGAIERRLHDSLRRVFSADDLLHLVQMDINQENFIVDGKGRLFVVDFDHMTYGPFQLQIAGGLENIHAERCMDRLSVRPMAERLASPMWDAPAEPYFSALPTSYRERWEATREDIIPIAFVLAGGARLLRQALHARLNPLRLAAYPRIAGDMMRQLRVWVDA